MPFPDSPFQENFNCNLITKLKGNSNHSTNANAAIQLEARQFQNKSDELKGTLNWLCTCPGITSFRVNTLKTSVGEIKRIVEEQFLHKGLNLKVYIHSKIKNAIIIEHQNNVGQKLERFHNEIIVDTDCAGAVLRGAHIFAPGVMSMITGTQINEKVSIYVDVYKKCRKGLNKIFQGEKIFIGNGLVRKMRHELFGENIKPSGIAIEVTDTISNCPILGDNFLSPGSALLQNLPSIVCVLNLNPQPNEIILDMCAAPGNKTTHIGELMQNKGTLIAIDKTPNKVRQLNKRCEEFGIKVKILEADSTTLLTEKNFGLESNSFDRILLDAPCSVLGKRPQFFNNINEKTLTSYVPLQRKLFETAVQLLKPNGTLVYSTCTITLAENEGIVAWALKTFPCLELFKPEIYVSGPGWEGTNLTNDQKNLLQRFGPNQEIDSVGFFISCFNKKCTDT